jgi:hypothetical protein
MASGSGRPLRRLFYAVLLAAGVTAPFLLFLALAMMADI